MTTIETVIMDFDEQHKQLHIYYESDKQYQRYGLQVIEICKRFGFAPIHHIGKAKE